VETAALWQSWKNKLRFPTTPTALGKLANRRRVFHSPHSPDYEINKTRKKAKLLNRSYQLLLHFQIESAIHHFPFFIFAEASFRFPPMH